MLSNSQSESVKVSTQTLEASKREPHQSLGRILNPVATSIFLDGLKKACSTNASVSYAPESEHHIQPCLRYLKEHKNGGQLGAREFTGTCTPLQFHTYWKGVLGPLQILSILSFVKTQSPCSTLNVWLHGHNGHYELSEFALLKKRCMRGRVVLQKLQKQQLLDLARGTILEAQAEHYATTVDSPDPTAINATPFSDFIRMLLFLRHGGVWFDIDTVLLRDFKPLLDYEFVYRWSMADTFNTAISHFHPNSSLLPPLIAHNTTNLHPDTISQSCKDIPLCREGLVVFPSYLFDPYWVMVDKKYFPNDFSPYGGNYTGKFEDFFTAARNENESVRFF